MQSNTVTQEPDAFVRQAQLIPKPLPFSAATLWRMVAAGEFPKPVKLGPRITAWRQRDVDHWIAERAEK